jgi:hypothetical protein
MMKKHCPDRTTMLMLKIGDPGPALRPVGGHSMHGMIEISHMAQHAFPDKDPGDRIS